MDKTFHCVRGTLLKFLIIVLLDPPLLPPPVSLLLVLSSFIIFGTIQLFFYSTYHILIISTKLFKILFLEQSNEYPSLPHYLTF